MKESHIEDAFCEYLEQQTGYHLVERQVKLPLGKLDVLAYWSCDDYAFPVVVEIKKGAADERACTQLLGYMVQVEYLMRSNSNTAADPGYGAERCRGILVGAEMTEFVQRVVLGMGMDFITYQLQGEAIEFLHKTECKEALAGIAVEGRLRDLQCELDTAKAIHRIEEALFYRNWKGFIDKNVFPISALNQTLRYWPRL